MKLDIVVEPTFIALGPFHMAVGINDRAWIYNIQEHGENCVDLWSSGYEGVTVIYVYISFMPYRGGI